MSSFDVIIIGSGPGGYVSAIRCSQLGLKTAIIEKYSTLGGTCLNVGCIPSKSLLASSHLYEELQHFSDHGIDVSGEVKVNLEKMIARKQAIVDQTSGGVKFLMDKNNITVYEGLGSFESATHVKITKSDGKSETIEGKNIIIATGSKPSSLPFITIDKERIITSTEALKLKEIPKHLIIIGGGVVGDVGALAASLYLRGIIYFHIPSTMTAIVDSCIGGKTAINYRNIINSLGNYYHASRVYISLDLINKLDK